MTCQHLGHEHDCDPDPECAGCGEVVHDQAAHHCQPCGWSTHVLFTDTEIAAFLAEIRGDTTA